MSSSTSSIQRLKIGTGTGTFCQETMMLKTAALLVIGVNGLYNFLFGIALYDTSCEALMFLSDITRPAFLIDLRAVQRAYWSQRKELDIATTFVDEYSVPIPPILLSQSKDVLVPHHLISDSTSTEGPHIFDQTADPADILRMEHDGSLGDICFGYIHCQVMKPSPSKMHDGTFLCQLNLNSTVFAEEQFSTVGSSEGMAVAPAHLVLGLNNHHVISYYWARSAGSGAAMEAPGVIVVNDATTSSTSNVQIRWASPEGYTACNSNDGKRSEWVQYLKENDQIQLRPNSFEVSLRSETLRDSIYGITMSGRPLGSEPIVVCQWTISTSS